MYVRTHVTRLVSCGYDSKLRIPGKLRRGGLVNGGDDVVWLGIQK